MKLKPGDMVASGISTCLYGAILPKDPNIWGWKLNFNTDTGIWVSPNSPMLVLAAEDVFPNEATCVFVAAARAVGWTYLLSAEVRMLASGPT